MVTAKSWTTRWLVRTTASPIVDNEVRYHGGPRGENQIQHMITHVGGHTRLVTDRKAMPSTQITEQGPDNMVRSTLSRAQLVEVEVSIATEHKVRVWQRGPDAAQGSIKGRPEAEAGFHVGTSMRCIEGADSRGWHSRTVAQAPPKELRVTGGGGLIHRGTQTGNGISYQNTSVRLARLGVTEKTEGLVRRKTAVLSAVRLLETTDPTAHAIEQLHKAIEGGGEDVVVQPQMVAVQGRKAKRHRRTRRPATACTPEPFPGSTAEVSSR